MSTKLFRIFLFLFCLSFPLFAEQEQALVPENEPTLMPRAYNHKKRLPSTYAEITSVIKDQKFPLLKKIIKKQMGSNFSIYELKDLAEKENCKPVSDSMAAANAMHKLDCGLSKKKLAQLALFLETDFAKYIKRGKHYLSREKLKIPCPVQYDPETGRKYIHLDGEIGKGSKKRVSKSILYDRVNPELVARCMQSRRKAVSRERRYTKLAQGPGVVVARGYTTHRSHGKNFYTIFCNLYKPGSLKTFFEEKPLKLTFREKLGICLNIARGLERLHVKNVVHRDLGTGNYLINVDFDWNDRHKPKSKRARKIDVVLADLGSAYHIKKVAGERPQGHTIFTGPEGVYRDSMKGKDYLGTDIFAVGSMFYRILYNKTPGWQKVNYIKKAKGSKNVRYHKLFKAVAKGSDKRRSELSKKKKTGKELSARELFERLILQMCHKRPELRPNAVRVRELLENIEAKLNGSRTSDAKKHSSKKSSSKKSSTKKS